VRDGQVCLSHGAHDQLLIKLGNIALLRGDAQSAKLETVLAAVAVVWALQITPELMRAGLETYLAK
jgi:cyanophycin synthetase